jgi:hypothetical protein
VKTIFQIGKIFLCSAILFLIAGCGVWHELHFTKTKPKESDLIGIYEPDANTKKLILQDGGYSSADCQIKLNADGKIELINMPDWWTNGFGESHRKLISSDGVWKLANSGNGWGINREIGNVIDGGFNLLGEKPPYKIHIYVGDTDSDRFMIFERAQK